MCTHQTDISKVNILVVDDTPDNLDILMQILTEHEYKVRIAPNGEIALKSVEANIPDLILLDIRMPVMDGYQLCERLKADEHTRAIPVIFISALGEMSNKVKGFSLGGVDYITKPFQPEEVLARVQTHLTLRRLQKNLQEENARRREVEEDLQQINESLEERVKARTEALEQSNSRLGAEITEHHKTEKKLQQSLAEIQQLKEQLQAENIYLREEIKLEHNFEEIIGQSHLIQYLLFKVEQVASTDMTVLILGETGTGKELIARAIHHTSPRKERPLVKVNCAVLPAHLIESELFGHEKGAFTGAQARQIGRFELAQGSSIFLDEIGELPLELQAKLLRVLQDGEFERLGNPRTIKTDARIIAATNRDLKAEAQAGRFRRDLYYRLNKYPLSVPPLRERREDIPLLVQAFVQKFSKKLGKQVEMIPQHTLHTLQQYAWPGNVRELENLIERAMIMTLDNTLRIEFPETSKTSDSTVNTNKTLEEVERDYILRILAVTNWKINGEDGAAHMLGLHPSTLRSRLKKLRIRRTTTPVRKFVPPFVKT